MANQKKTYFIADSFNWGAEDGPVRLGNIIASVGSPQEARNSIPVDLPHKYTMPRENWKSVEKRYHDGIIGIWARFIDAIGLGGQIGVEWGKKGVHTFEFKKLETKYIIPDEDYVKKRLNDPKVQDFLKGHNKRCYMITGLMIAHQPIASSLVGSSANFQAKLGAELPGGVGQVGPKVGYEYGSSSQVSFDGGESFVFALQFRAFRCKIVEEKVEVTSSKPVTGGWYGRPDEQSSNEQAEDKVLSKAELVTLFENNVTAEDAGMKAEEAIDDFGDEACECVVLRSLA